ncbi:hypothetical protein [Natrialba asiatica]|uniref:Uncharacterized protein n=1 Tax=Natrialba asiatica (strain ATCC 700177 / DSM 12278 / JCM 9576 / FERM P-10747 / NBRC 102637 / 172P1) TaxID=29540 RepID=M0AYR1_NATA1|nr:hypothetical protein [Natrialba asiatica]ELZ03108.1 hypothetical protein C481_05945 [Natrialba asiatica DSM 12278]
MTTTESETTANPNRKRNRADTKAMGEVSHTNPYTGETAGRLFNRGPIVAADGGRPAATDPESRSRRGSAGDSTETMRDISHTPPNDSDDANRVFERGQADADTDAADDDEVVDDT